MRSPFFFSNRKKPVAERSTLGETMMNHQHSTASPPSSRKKSRWGSPLNLITHVMVGAGCFQIGLMVGGGGRGSALGGAKNAQLVCPPNNDPVAPRKARLAQLGKRLESDDGALFPPTLKSLFVGAARVNRTEFVELLDVGVPWDPNRPGNEQVLLLYSSEKSLPDQRSNTAKFQVIDAPTEEALQNCHAVKVVLLQPSKPNHCVALVGQWESHHVHLFRRTPPEGPVPRGKPKPDMTPRRDLPLRYVRRSIGDDGTEAHGLGLPSLRDTKDNWVVLTEYLSKLQATLERLRPVARAAAAGSRAVVVMMVNFGQTLLFENFVCAARARNLDLSHVLMFATDQAAVDVATSLGVNVFDVQDAFGDLPENAARFYGDPMFKRMMLAKVYCVHLMVLLGYDVLFQDVDIVWHRDPVPFFYKRPVLEYDILFQDDGSRSVRYAPYSPNSGFYFVRNSLKTQYFFNVLVRSGDLVIKYRSHQAALNALLTEHASWKGLRVKVFGRDTDDGTLFPGGYHYHRRKDYMKRMLQGETTPYIFHMSWTESKDNKLLFLKQLGEWYVQPTCEGKKFEDVAQGDANHDRAAACCSAEPLVQCFYRDKPSKIPCRGSDPIDKGRPSFW